MQMTMENTPAPRLHPIGASRATKVKDKSTVVGTLIEILVSAHKLPRDVARAVAPAVYDGYVATFGAPPANAGYVDKAIATEKGKAKFNQLVAPHLEAYNAAKAAELAQKKAPEVPAPVVVKAKADEPRVSASTQKVLTTMLEKAVRLFIETGNIVAMHTVLVHLAQRCWDEGTSVFDASYVYGSEEGLAIGGVLAQMPIKGFWINFPKPVTTSKAPFTPKMMAADIEEDLNDRLEEAVKAYWRGGNTRTERAHGEPALDDAIHSIAADVKDRGFRALNVRIGHGSEAGNLLGGRLKANPAGIRLNFVEGGGIDIRSADHPPMRRNGPTYVRPAQTERTPEEAETARLKRLKREQALAERRDRDRAARAAARGKAGDGGGNNKGGKKKGK